MEVIRPQAEGRDTLYSQAKEKEKRNQIACKGKKHIKQPSQREGRKEETNKKEERGVL